MKNIESVIARIDHTPALAAALGQLDGCPVGYWGETQQAMSRIYEQLPERDERDYSIHDLIGRLYAVDHAGRYRSLRARAYAKEQARLAWAAIPGRPEPIELSNGDARVRCSVGDDGYIVIEAIGDSEYSDAAVARALPVEWLLQAQAVRAGVLAALRAEEQIR